MTKRLMIVGGTGFFGKALFRYLSRFIDNNKWDIEAVCFVSRNPNVAKQFFGGDVGALKYKLLSADVEASLDHLAVFEPTHLIHAASDSTNGHQLSHFDRFRQIVKGTENVLDFVVKTKVEKLLYISSGAVYGGAIDEGRLGWTEGSYCAPTCSEIEQTYGLAKRNAESLCWLYSSEFAFQFSVARCFSFVGPDLPLNKHFAIGNFIRNALACEDIVVNGDGTPLRSYLHQEQLAEWLLKILFDGSNNTFNVGSDEAVSILQLAETISKVCNSKNTVIVKGRPELRDGEERSVYIPNIDKIKTEFNVTPLPIEVCIEKTINELASAT